ncbi:divalent-cation tolerance protein CutA [Qipengyuania aquimaris]|uniref:Divalent-cation tolerance protein CutA n=1 Tax=Qipengyuania aquimaris TaxID=255984 RepID=A0A9Q3XE49_9SPHN|nr:divalent-cation tolerance protein CutA [Qipengyuania aquimaris]MBY6219099.1 divalent-cation tolerance protein CutA [Qipengyuania aquimaris]
MTALIYCPFPDRETAERIGAQLLDEQLIGCINIGGPIRSLFVWDGEKGEGEEVPALLKTDAAKLRQAIDRIEHLHPYDTPAIVGWPCEASAGTSAWLGQLHGGKSGVAS